MNIHKHTCAYSNTLIHSVSRNKQVPPNSPLGACARALPVLYPWEYWMEISHGSLCSFLLANTRIKGSDPQLTSGVFMLAFLALYTVLFFITNLIDLHSPQGAAADSSLPIIQTHLCYFDLVVASLSSGLCTHVPSRKTLVQDALGHTSQLVLPKSFCITVIF